MKANAVPLIAIFEKKMRLEVPLFQRPYVWDREKQWEPLWEDISRKFVEYLEGRTDTPVHFLGALVLDQKQTPTTHVERRQVIDGQQRLTTLQIFLVAFRDCCRKFACEELARECDTFTQNKGMMNDPQTEKYKVWPTQRDRPVYQDVVTKGSPDALRAAYQLVRQKYARQPDPRPRLVECYLYFSAQIEAFFGGDGEPPLLAAVPLAERLETAFQALRNALYVVVIDLEPGDDAQVIFETLNARGEPLLPADLLRNYIFLRAARNGEEQDALYDKYWRDFDDDFWRSEVTQGRNFRPKSDLFLQHFLSSQKGVDVPAKHLYAEYRHWIERTKPFASVEAELVVVARNGGHFRSLMEASLEGPLRRVAEFLQKFEVSTSYPFLLATMDAADNEQELREIGQVIESYLIRRIICDMTAKNLNRVFLTLSRIPRAGGATAVQIRSALGELAGESAEWPTDERFRAGWRENRAYGRLNSARVCYVLSRLNETYQAAKTESVLHTGDLSVEHIMPQAWIENWLLQDAASGMCWSDLFEADDDDPRAVATRARDAAIHGWGNLTILTQALNTSASNAGWEAKKPEILRHSLLPINLSLGSRAKWDEADIQERSEELFERALKVWPRQ